MFGIKKKPMLTISEPDLQGALAHLRSLPFVSPMPLAWDRKRLIEHVREAFGANQRVNGCADVAPGVLAQIKPLGVDLAGWDDDDLRLQVCLYVRGWGTYPVQIVEI